MKKLQDDSPGERVSFWGIRSVDRRQKPIVCRTAPGAAVFLGLLLVVCNAARAADPSGDLKAWQGAWRLVASTYDAKPQNG
jgi:hypothetical protein